MSLDQDKDQCQWVTQSKMMRRMGNAEGEVVEERSPVVGYPRIGLSVGVGLAKTSSRPKGLRFPSMGWLLLNTTLRHPPHVLGKTKRAHCAASKHIPETLL